MAAAVSTTVRTPQGAHAAVLHRRDVRTAWSFVYGFFSNGTPFDAPNRSEPCCLYSQS